MATAADAAQHAAAIEFLFGRLNYERTPTVPYQSNTFKLERMVELARRLENPQDQLRIVHVAGSKGKGSTATMIAAMLKAAGYKVGLYTSPHVTSPEERINVDLQPCTAVEFADLIAQIRPHVLVMDADRSGQRGATYFEILTAAGLLHFAQQQVDVAVVEVGLGGRLDSTNICQPACSVITSISRDHTRQLGETLPEIAGEKAGIIKPQTPVVCGVTDPAARQVIHDRAAQLEAPLYQLDRDFAVRITDDSRLPATFRYEPLVTTQPVTALDDLQTAMLGRHQILNAAVAIRCVQVLTEQGLEVRGSDIRRGLAAARCIARIEVVSHQPLVILDAAHNEASMQALVDTLTAHWPDRRRTFLLAATRGKDLQGMLRRLLPHCDRLILTRYLDNPRCCDPQQLASAIDKLTDELGLPRMQTAIEPDPQAAWQQVRATAAADELVCITGSFFLAAELRSQFHPDSADRIDAANPQQFVTAIHSRSSSCWTQTKYALLRWMLTTPCG